MPREIISSLEAGRILSTGKLRVIDAVCEISHSEIVYEIFSSASTALLCDHCGQSAKFIQHTRDHAGQNFMALTCHTCAPPGYLRLLEQRLAG